MAQDQNNLVWLDMEMTGLDPDKDRIIEIAVVVTDSQLNALSEAPVLVVHQPDSVLDTMDDWNKSTHARTGLIGKVKARLRPCAATRFARTGASSRVICRVSRPIFTIAIWTSAP